MRDYLKKLKKKLKLKEQFLEFLMIKNASFQFLF